MSTLNPEAVSFNGSAQNGVANGVQSPQTNGEQWSVESALSELPSPYPANPTTPIPFFHLLERLKTTPRAGWKRFGLSPSESISDHMYRMSLLTMLAPSSLTSQLNIPHCSKMALIHDMAEALVGDITPVDGISKTEKSRRESETMEYICSNLLGTWNGGLNGKEIRQVWQEYEDNTTKEAQFVHDIDKMELILQMVEYERAVGCRVDLSEFTWVAGRIEMPEVKQWAAEVLRERKELWQSVGKTPTWKGDTEPKE